MSIERLVSPKSRCECVDYTGVHHQHLLNNDNSIKRSLPPPEGGPAMQQQLNVPRLRNMNHESTMDKGIIINSSRTTTHHNILATSRTTTNRFPLMSPRTIVFEQHSSTEDDDESSSLRDSSVSEHYLRDVPEGGGLVPRHPRNVKRNNDRRARQLAPTSQEEGGRPSSASSPYYCWENRKRLDDFSSSSCRHSQLIDNGGGTYSLSMCSSSSSSTTSGTESLQRRWGQRKRTSETTIPHPAEQGGWVNRRRPALLETDRHQSEVSSCDTMTVCCLANTDSSTPATTTPPPQRDEEDMSSSHHLRHSSPSTNSYQSQGRTSSSGGHPQTPETGTIPIRTVVSSTADADIVHKISEDQQSQMVSPQRVFGRGPPSRVVSSSDEVIVTVLDHPQATTESGQLNSPTTTTNQSSRAVQHGFVLVGAECLASSSSSSSATSSSSSSCSSNARMVRRQKQVVCNSTVSISSHFDDEDVDVDGLTNSCSCVMTPSGKVDPRLKQSPQMQWSHNNNNNNNIRSECSDSTNNDSGTFSWVPPGDATIPNNSPTIFEQNVLVVGSPSSNKSDSNKKNHNLQALSSRHHRSTMDKRSRDITTMRCQPNSNVEVIPNSRPSLLNVKRKEITIEQHVTSRAGALTAREPPTEPKRYDAPLLHLKTFDVNSKSLNSSPSEQQQHNMVKSSNSLIYSTRFRAAAAEVVEEMKAKSIDLTTIIPIEQLSFFLIRKQQTNNVKSASNNPELVSSNIPAPCGYSPNQLTQMGLTPFKINSGTFCSVYKAKYKNMVVAVKCPNEALLKSDASMMRYRALLEWKILSRTKHDNVLTFYGGLIFGAQVWLITAYAEGGDLYTLLYHRPVEQLSAPVRLRLMSELANAVAYLHSMDPPVAHKDLKCNNLLVDSNDHLGICDFGDAEEMKSPFIQCCTAATWQYTPPELLASDDPSRPKNATEKVDVWALGCVYLEILKCPTPFVHILDTIGEDKQRETLRSLLLNSQLEKERRVPASLPRLIRLLILSCLEFIPAQRISAAQLALFLRRHHHDLLEEIELWQARALHKERTQIVMPSGGGGRPLPRLEHQLSSSSLVSSCNAAHHIELQQHSTREHVAYRAAGVQLNSTSGSVLSSQDTGTEDSIAKHQQKDYYVQHQKNEDSGLGIDPDCGGGNSHHGYGLFRPMSARDNGNSQLHHYQFQKRSMKPTYDSNVVFLKSSRAALDGLITARLSKGNGTEVSGGHSGRSLLNTSTARRPVNNQLGRSFMYKGDDSTSSSSGDEDDDDDLDHVIYCQQNDTHNTRRKPCILSEPDFNRQQLNNIQRTHRRGNVVELKQAVTSSSTDRSNSPRLVSLASDRYYQPPMNSGRASGELTSFRTGQGFIVRGVEQRHVNAQNVAPAGMCGSCQENVVTTTTNHQVLLPLPSRRTKSIREDYYNGGGNRPHSAKENYSNNKINVCTIRNLEHHQTGDNSDSNVNGTMVSARRGNIDCLRRVTSTRPTTMRGIGEKIPAWGGSTTSNSVTSSSPPGERLDTSQTGNGNSYYNENNVMTSNMVDNHNNPPTHMRPMCAVVMRNCGMKLRQMNSAHAHVAKPLSILKSAGPIHSSDASSITFPQYNNNRTMAQHNNSVFSRGTSARNNNNNSGALVDVWHPCRPAPIRNYEIRKIMLSPETSSSSGNPNSHHFQVLAPSARMQQRQVHQRLIPTGGFSTVQGDATVVSSVSHGGPHNGGTLKFDRNSVFQVLPVSRQQQQPSIRQFSRPPDDKLGGVSARQVASRM